MNMKISKWNCAVVLRWKYEFLCPRMNDVVKNVIYRDLYFSIIDESIVRKTFVGTVQYTYKEDARRPAYVLRTGKYMQIRSKKLT